MKYKILLLSLIILLIPILSIWADSKNFELVGKGLKFAAQCVYVVGNYAYVTDGWGLIILDVGNPSNPNEISSITISGVSNGVFVVGDYAYVAAGSNGLTAIDVSDPTNPRIVGNSQLTNRDYYASNVYVVGNYAYVAACLGGLRIVDISDPTNLHEVGFYKANFWTTDIYVVNNYAYSSVLGDLHVIDVSDPKNPSNVSICELNFADGVYIEGNYAYVTATNDNNGFYIIDVSNPRDPHIVGTFNTPGFAGRIYVADKCAYMANDVYGLRVVDVSDPKNPFELGFFDPPDEKEHITSVYVDNGYVYTTGTEYVKETWGERSRYGGLYILKYIEPPCIKGDVNGDNYISSNDAILVLRISAGLINPTSQQKCTADMNNDGKINSVDAILILRKVAGLGAPTRDFIADRYINISLAEIYGLKGETTSVPITVDNADILSSGDMSISYDSKVLRAIDVLSSDGLFMADNISQPGLIRISFAGIGRLNDDKLAEIRFEVLTDDVSPLTFKMAELYGYDALPLNSRVTNKQFRSWAFAPERSALMQNYPNPFNPETWIPYQLHEASEVIIRIHNVTGELVREIGLGYKPAGLYTSQDRSAYWDGRNESGERVSSGVYFYNIQAGKYTATMKMIVTK